MRIRDDTGRVADDTGLSALWAPGLCLLALSAIWLVPSVWAQQRNPGTSWWQRWRAEPIRPAVYELLAVLLALAGVVMLLVSAWGAVTGT